MRLNIHLTFNGQCHEAFLFYAGCLGGEITTLLPYGSSPMAGTAPAMRDRILHATLTLAEGRLTGVDVASEKYEPPRGFTVQLNFDHPTRAEQIFSAPAAGGVTHLPLQQTFWATRYGIVTDRFGTPWEINCGDGA